MRMLSISSIMFCLCTACDDSGDSVDRLSESEVDAFVENNGYASQADLDAAQSELAALENDLTVATAQVDAIGTDLTGLEGDVDALSSSLALTDSSLGTLASDVDALNAIHGEQSSAISISALSLVGDGLVRQTGSGRAYLNDQANDLGGGRYLARATAPVALPHGATITAMACRFDDSNDDGALRMRLRKHSDGLAGEVTVAEIASELLDTPGRVDAMDTELEEPVVDNVGAAYYFLAIFEGPLTNRVWLSRCTIEFTVDPLG